MRVPFAPLAHGSSSALFLQPQQRLGFAHFVWLNDVRRALVRKFPKLAVTDAVLYGDVQVGEQGTLLRTLEALHAPVHQRQLYAEFLLHTTHCWLAKSLSPTETPLALDVVSLKLILLHFNNFFYKKKLTKIKIQNSKPAQLLYLKLLNPQMNL